MKPAGQGGSAGQYGSAGQGGAAQRPVDSGGRLVFTGNAIVDLVLPVPHLPERGGDVMASGAAMLAGGGFNVMAAAARQGMSVLYAGALGTGPLADIVSRALADEGIEVANPPLAGIDTGFSAVLVEPDGERTFFSAPGAEAHLTAEALDITLRPGDWVYITGYSLTYPANQATIVGWLEKLPERTNIVLDPGPLGAGLAPELLDTVLRRCRWCTANTDEARALTGRDNPAEAAVALARRTGGGALVRCGAAGCIVVDGGQVRTVGGFAVQAVDLNGAGDAHTGVFLATLAAGADPVAAARRANAAAAVAVTRIGPATAPRAAELDLFLLDGRLAGGAKKA